MSGVLLLSLAGLALVDSTSFGTLGIPVFLLLTTFAAPAAVAAEPGEVSSQAGQGAAAGRSGLGRLFVYLGTVGGCYFLLGVVLMTGAGAVAEPLGRLLGGDVGRWLELVAGVALFALSFRFDSKRAARRGESRLMRRLTGGPGAMAALGLTAAALEAATMLPYLAALGLMTAAGLPAVQWVPLLAAYVAIMIVPALVLILVRLTAGGRVQSLLERIGAFIRKHSASAIGWTLGIIGFLLARDAAAHLFFMD